MEKLQEKLMERQNILVALRSGIIDVETAEALLDELFREYRENEEPSDDAE
jgi:hypothetical protein